jgi:predicted membrane channel-forming protein YqfA (hemolysin III family)
MHPLFSLLLLLTSLSFTGAVFGLIFEAVDWNKTVETTGTILFVVIAGVAVQRWLQKLPEQ